MNLSALLAPIFAAAEDGRIDRAEEATIVAAVADEVRALAIEEAPALVDRATTMLVAWVERMLHPDPTELRALADEVEVAGHETRAKHLRARAGRVEARQS